jgi:sugar transferase (PEP-CTERM/EpsH1 system associated)
MNRRILFVSQQLPWPKDSGGNIRTYHMLEALTQHFKVSFCSTSDGSEAAREGQRRLGEMCAELHIVPDQKQMTSWGQVKGVAQSLLRGESAALQHNRNTALAGAVKDVLDSGSLDSVHLNHLDTTPYINFGDAPPAVIDTHNLLFDYYARRAQMESGVLRKWVCRRESRLLQSVERESFRKARRTVVCSETERRRLHELDSSLKVDVVPNGVDCSAVQPLHDVQAAESRELVFVGDMAYGPNQDAAMHFIRDVFPLVLAAEPRAKFLAVGKNPSAELVALGRAREEVIVSGFVQDVAEWVQRAEIYVVPIRYGSGTRLKVLEALAFGKPTVSTSVGAEGIDYSDGKDILIRDDPQAMAQAIVDLFADTAQARGLALAARKTAETRYDWKQIGERMADIHRHLA